MRTIALLGGLLGAAVPAMADDVPSGPASAITRATLPDGLQIVLAPDHGSPVVAVRLVYRVGSGDDPPNRSGLAHLCEHLMFQGSKHVPEDAYFALLERAGATFVNGDTQPDRTEYLETVPANQLELALWLESDRMGFLLDHVDSSGVESQREIIGNELRQNPMNGPYGHMDGHVRAALYPAGHLYNRAALAWANDLDLVTLDDVRRFIDSWYAPNNATLTLAGDFDPANALALVQKYFGPIPAGVLPQRISPPPRPLRGETQLEIGAGVESPAVEIAWPTPPLFSPGDADLDALATILAGSRASRLSTRLVERDAIAVAVHAHQASTPSGSMFSISAVGKPGGKAAALLIAIDDELQRFARDGPTPEEIAGEQRNWETFLTFRMQGLLGRAEVLDSIGLYVSDGDGFSKNLARYRATTTTSVRDATRLYLPLDRRVVALVAPFRGAIQAGTLLHTRIK